MNARTLTVRMLAALLAVLTLASSAWAECAWVLWAEAAGPDMMAGSRWPVADPCRMPATPKMRTEVLSVCWG